MGLRQTWLWEIVRDWCEIKLTGECNQLGECIDCIMESMCDAEDDKKDYRRNYV